MPQPKCLSSLSRVFKRFLRNDSANVTIMAGLAVIPMFLAAGAAVDMVRINREQATFQAAVDSATLAVAADNRSALAGLTGSALEARIEELEDFAREFINVNYSAERSNAGSVTINLTANDQAIQIMAHNEFPTTIMKLAGVNSLELDAFTEVRKAIRPTEFVMVFDTTGSMNGSPIAALKAGARSMIATIYQGDAASVHQSEFIRMALVPFALAVRLNPSAFDYNANWIDTTGANPLSKINFNSTTWHNMSAWSQLRSNVAPNPALAWNGCVESRSRSSGGVNLIANDVAPTSADTRFPAYFSPDTPYDGSGTVTDASNNFSNGYIFPNGTSVTLTPAQENSGLTTAQRDSYTTGATGGLMFKQKNQNKYVNRQIEPEIISGTYNAMRDQEGPWKGCAKSRIVPMTYNRDNIEAGITAMTAYGGTNIAEGMAWGLRAVSPGEPFTKVEPASGIPASTISPYGSPQWQKVMVLMTDGENNIGAGSDSLNGSSYSSYGFGNTPIANNRFGTTSSSAWDDLVDADMTSTCTMVKNSGVELYVVSYGALSTTTQNTLRACATDAAHYQHTTTTLQMTNFFDHIGQQTLNKMIYVSK